MDRNTVVGLVLIGLILSVFTIFNQPSDEELKAEKERIERAEKAQKEKEEKAAAKVADKKKKQSDKKTSNWIAKLDDKGEQMKDSTGALIYVDTVRNVDTVMVQVAETKQESKELPTGEIILLEN